MATDRIEPLNDSPPPDRPVTCRWCGDLMEYHDERGCALCQCQTTPASAKANE